MLTLLILVFQGNVGTSLPPARAIAGFLLHLCGCRFVLDQRKKEKNESDCGCCNEKNSTLEKARALPSGIEFFKVNKRGTQAYVWNCRNCS